MANMSDDRAYPGDPRLRSSASIDAPSRQRLIEPHLPAPRARRTTSSRSRKHKSKPIRRFLKSKVHYLAYFLIHIFLGIYIRLRQTYHAVVDRILAILYYHHRTPELIRKDVRGLSQLPEHLSTVLTLSNEGDGVETLMDEVADLAAWSSCAGIPMLSIYEKTGTLKNYIPALHQVIISKFSTYYGHASHQPTLNLFAPHHALYAPPSHSTSDTKSNPDSLTVLLLSSTDGRDTLVDLTKTLAEMAQHGKLSPQDISTKLIDAEISEMMSTPTPASSSPSPAPAARSPTRHARSGTPTQSPPGRIANGTNGTNGTQDINGVNGNGVAGAATSTPLIKPEPDLLVIFGPIVRLDGYPPWQIRLTEIFCTGDKSSNAAGEGEAVEYQRFLQGLWRFARAEMRFGR